MDGDAAGAARGTRVAGLLLGTILGILSYSWIAGHAEAFDPGEFGLGRNTVARRERGPNGLMSGHAEHLSEILDTSRSIHAEGTRVALWLGASQLHAINQLRVGDHLAVAHANRRAEGRGAGLRYVQLSEPNANLHELWAVLAAVLRDEAPDLVILAFTYDDLRELGIRPEIRPLYAIEPVDEAVLSAAVTNDAQLPETCETPQAQLEDFLVGRLEGVWPLFALRDRARALVETVWRESITRLVFAIRNRPQERVASERAEWNARAFDKILDELDARRIPIVVYQAPHQPGLTPFYHPRDEYDEWQARVRARVEERQRGRWVDLEGLVDAELWGISAAGEPDVFHFQGEGHRLLGDAIDRFVEESGI